MKRIVLFHRDFRQFTGGHLKVWNYFNHVRASQSYEPRIAFTAESKWDETNPWWAAKEYVTDWNPETADVLFLAGADWKRLPLTPANEFSKPIINLIQHPRHADPDNEVHRFLTNRAIRICVSNQTAEAIKATGKVNGPLFVIPNGIDLADFPTSASLSERPIEVLICGLKVPDLARQIQKRLERDENIAVTPLLDWLPRANYFRNLASAKIAVMLPRPREGFYLPALEAMACGAIVVCPDCIGNRDFCRDGVNCFRPNYDVEEIIGAIYRALALSADEADRMRSHASDTVKEHSLERERESFLEILERIDAIWTRK
jgi:glycosyltransferase involved in cell wall biosynthesis